MESRMGRSLTRMNLMKLRTDLRDDYSISKVIKGGWQLAGGHGHIDEQQAIANMSDFVLAGITTFDCADIYTGVEELIGKFLRKHRHEFISGELPPVQVLDVFLPNGFQRLRNFFFIGGAMSGDVGVLSKDGGHEGLLFYFQVQ